MRAGGRARDKGLDYRGDRTRGVLVVVCVAATSRVQRMSCGTHEYDDYVIFVKMASVCSRLYTLILVSAECDGLRPVCSAYVLGWYLMTSKHTGHSSLATIMAQLWRNGSRRAGVDCRSAGCYDIARDLIQRFGGNQRFT